MGSKAAGRKMVYTSISWSGETRASKHAFNLFGSDLSASDSEIVPIEWPRKCSKETSLALDVPKFSVWKGMFE
jgi:hypothetical protein